MKILFSFDIFFFTGMLVGLIIKYSGGVNRAPGTMVSLPKNLTSIPDSLWVHFGSKKYSYSLKGPLYTTSKDGGDELENKVRCVT